MATVNAKLNREDAAGATVPWLLVGDADNPSSGLSDPVVDHGARARLVEVVDALATVVAQLAATLTVVGEVALDTPTIAALMPQTDALTDAELRDAPVPVAGPLTDAQLRGDAVRIADSRHDQVGLFRCGPGEELRRDPGTLDPAQLYHGAAPAGSVTSDPVWDVVRFDIVNGEIVRRRFRTGIVWDDRDAGW